MHNLKITTLQLKDRDEKLGEAGELQHFLGNLDHFQHWLQRTQTTVASEDIPNSLSDAERLLNQHQQLKDEIDAYSPEYAKMKDFGDRVTEGQTDPQYMFLAQVNLCYYLLCICILQMLFFIIFSLCF